MAYSITAASQGRVIRPSLVKPNCSWEICRSCAKSVVLRYSNGTSKRFPSAEYMTQWPLLATEVQYLSTSFGVLHASCFLFSAAILCHFLASWAILLALIMISFFS
ncbi:hypothetical protein QOZ80_6BG0481360 [Eleusine coracana subsp. coracana]|nr:hypothetical protein QOZ80_6BG0481360 [Eleusine coracana subsp. coracana]